MQLLIGLSLIFHTVLIAVLYFMIRVLEAHISDLYERTKDR